MNRRQVTCFVFLAGALAAISITVSGENDGQDAIVVTQAQELFIQANESFHNEDYEKASELYGRLVKAGFRAGEVWYNLGCTKYRMNRLGEGLEAFREAEKLRPRDPNLAYNITLIQNVRADEIEEDTSLSFLRNIFFWHYSLNLKEAGRLFLLLYLSGWLFMGVRWMTKSRWTTILASILLVGALLVGSSLLVRHRANASPQFAVVTSPESVVYSGYLDSSQELFRLHDGAEGRLELQVEDWGLIALPDGKRGWIPLSDVVLF